MLDKITKIFKTSLIYGLSSMAMKASGIILLPIHLRFFSVEEYGRLGIMLLTVQLLSAILVIGQNQAVIRYSNIDEYKNEKGSYMFSLLLFLVLLTAGIIIVGKLSQNFLISISPQPEQYRDLINITIYLTAITMLNSVLTNKLRADDRPVYYAVAGMLKLVVIIVLTFYLIVHIGMNIEGVLYANLAGEIFSVLIVIPAMFRKIEYRFNSPLLTDSLRFGIPLVFSAIALNFLNGIDRYILQYISSEYELGLYELAYRIGGIISMFVVIPMNLAVVPVAYRIYKKPNDLYYYSKMMTFSLIVIAWPTLFISLFGKEIIMIFDKSANFYASASIVPYLALSYVFVGMTIISSLGLYLTGKTKIIAVLNFIVAMINVALNFILIPYYGATGAAIATVIAYIILYKISYYYSKKYHGFYFEFRKIYALLTFGIILYFIGILPDIENFYINIAYKLFIVALFPVIPVFTGYFAPHEKAAIMRILKSVKSPREFFKLLKGFFAGDLNL